MLSPVFEVVHARRVARTLLNTYVGKRTGERVLQGLVKRGDGETIHAALWFSDLRDFTALTETLPAAKVLAMLNAYFEHVDAAVTPRGGEILRFIGDAMLIVFPAQTKRRSRRGLPGGGRRRARRLRQPRHAQSSCAGARASRRSSSAWD